MELESISDRLILELQRCDLLVPGRWDECRNLGVFIHDEWYECLGDAYRTIDGLVLALRS
jgi:hypothetical protein